MVIAMQLFLQTRFGDCLLIALDDERRVLFANRHKCTNIDAAGTTCRLLATTCLGEVCDVKTQVMR